MNDTSKAHIGLCMIVKNEEPVIERCLNSVKPLIQTWTIVDTGSIDNTKQIIQTVMKDIPGELHERPWKNFGHNRTEAIQLARERSDYLFFIDADEILQFPEPDKLPALTADVYGITIIHGNLRYSRSCLVATRLPWKYHGVLHEYLDAGRHIEPTPISGLSVIYTHEGARSKNPRKYYDDALVFEQALKEEPDNLRYRYYLAQSWRDAGEIDKAIQAYQHRAALRGWVEEDWHARYQVARLMDRAHYPAGSVINAYLQAYDFRPTRAESLVWLGAYLRYRKRWSSAQALLLTANLIPFPKDRLFIEADCYGWRRIDELAMTYYHTDNKSLAKTLWGSILKDTLPQEQRLRIQKNHDSCPA